MRGVALTWSHAPLHSVSGGEGEEVGGGERERERVRAEVVERIELQPLEEKMVSDTGNCIYNTTLV